MFSDSTLDPDLFRGHCRCTAITLILWFLKVCRMAFASSSPVIPSNWTKCMNISLIWIFGDIDTYHTQSDRISLFETSSACKESITIRWCFICQIIAVILSVPSLCNGLFSTISKLFLWSLQLHAYFPPITFCLFQTFYSEYFWRIFIIFKDPKLPSLL